MTVSTSAATAAHVASVKSTICVRLLIAAMRRDMHAERQWLCRLVDRRKRLSHVAGRRLALLWGRRFLGTCNITQIAQNVPACINTVAVFSWASSARSEEHTSELQSL